MPEEAPLPDEALCPEEVLFPPVEPWLWDGALLALGALAGADARWAARVLLLVAVFDASLGLAVLWFAKVLL